MADGQASKNPSFREAKREALKMEPEIGAQWERFPSLPGTHLTMEKIGRQNWQLISTDGVVWASCDRPTFTDLKSVISASGWTCRWVQVSKPPMGDVALKAIGAIIKRADDSRDLVEAASNTLVLRVTGHHFNRKANSYLTMSDGTIVRLPVRGWNPKTGMMSAVTESGATLVHYRLNYSRNSRLYVNSNNLVEVAVSSLGLSFPGIQFVVAVTCQCLSSYFSSGGTF
jgi:hypothetical protein